MCTPRLVNDQPRYINWAKHGRCSPSRLVHRGSLLLSAVSAAQCSPFSGRERLPSCAMCYVSLRPGPIVLRSGQCAVSTERSEPRREAKHAECAMPERISTTDREPQRPRVLAALVQMNAFFVRLVVPRSEQNGGALGI